MKIGPWLYWGGLAVLYLVLAYRTYSWYNRFEEFDGDVLIGPTGSVTVLGEEDEQEDSSKISLSNFFIQVLKTDFLGFLLAGAGALLTAFGV